MKKLILILGLSFIGINGGESFAQLSLNCNQSGSLGLIGENTLQSNSPAECVLDIDNTVTPPVNISISVSLLTLNNSSSGEKPDPNGTTRNAQVIYNSNTINQGASQSNIVVNSSNTIVYATISVTRPKEFFAGTYQYDLPITITIP